jgi:hypothetical protein
MQDVVNSNEWRPTKDKLQFPLNSKVAAFMCDAWTEAQKAYASGPTAQEVLDILSDLEWEASETSWSNMTFQNRFKSLNLSDTRQLRFVVSLSSRGSLSTMFHMWYRS